MKVNKKSIYVLIVLLLLVIATITAIAMMPGKYDDFAKCLTVNGAKMYGTDWCSHCQNQKHEFGKSFKYIDFINCDYSSSVCSSKGVVGYPTWIINDEKYEGEQSFRMLAELTGCALKE